MKWFQLSHKHKVLASGQFINIATHDVMAPMPKISKVDFPSSVQTSE